MLLKQISSLWTRTHADLSTVDSRNVVMSQTLNWTEGGNGEDGGIVYEIMPLLCVMVVRALAFRAGLDTTKKTSPWPRGRSSACCSSCSRKGRTTARRIPLFPLEGVNALLKSDRFDVSSPPPPLANCCDPAAGSVERRTQSLTTTHGGRSTTGPHARAAPSRTDREAGSIPDGGGAV